MMSGEKNFICGVVNSLNNKVYLVSGMVASMEIQARQKRVIEIFLDPFRTYIREGVRER